MFAAEAAGTVRPARYLAIVSGELSAADPIEAVARKNKQLKKNDFKSKTETRVHCEMFKRRRMKQGYSDARSAFSSGILRLVRSV